MADQSMAATTAALATVPSRGQSSMKAVAQAMVQSRYFTDVKSSEQALIKLRFAEEIGIDALSAMGQIFFVNGKPAMTAALQARLIKSSGKYRYEVKEKTAKLCRIEFFELVDDIAESGKVVKRWKSIGVEEFTEEDAKLAGLLTGPNAKTYKSFPKGMFFARCLTNGFRTHCPDAIKAGGTAYLPEELSENVKVDYSTGEAVVVEIDGEIVNESKTKLQTLVALIAETGTDTSAVANNFNVAELKDLTDTQMDQAISICSAKLRARSAA